MSKKPEKEQRPLRRKTKMTDLELAEQLADSVLYASKKEAEKEHDPFEVYACQLKTRLFRKSKLFGKRFAEGYEVLLNALHTMQKQS